MVPSQHACPLANTCNDKNMSSSSEEEDIIHTNEVKFPIGREKFFTTLSYHYFFITVKQPVEDFMVLGHTFGQLLLYLHYCCLYRIIIKNNIN